MDILFDGWEQVFRAAATATFIYVAVVISVRLSGKRSTSQMNSFDWIVTVAMGSMVASAIVLKDTGVATVFAGLAVLLLLQWALTKTLTVWPFARRLVRASPTLLYYRGQFLEDNLRKERVLRNEILAAVREAGVGLLDEVEAVILETDADLSVIRKGDGRVPTTLEGVSGLPDSVAEAISKHS
ncbi:MAG: DUF421 domain-containing protein [Rhodothermaceae bacterium]|nr:DUF421 domain-containing protein [Rhodothermaceae bacterium]